MLGEQSTQALVREIVGYHPVNSWKARESVDLKQSGRDVRCLRKENGGRTHGVGYQPYNYGKSGGRRPGTPVEWWPGVGR